METKLSELCWFVMVLDSAMKDALAIKDNAESFKLTNKQGE